MLSMQPQADLPVRFSRLGTSALAGFTPASHAAFFEDSSATLETRKARYDCDFAKLGVPGLSFMSRSLSGDNITLNNGETGKEWERNTEIKYVVQSGAPKDVDLRLRNATYRSNYSARDADDVRGLVSYSVALW